MKRKLLLVFAVLLIVALIPVIASADVSDFFFETDLTADGGSKATAVDVGSVGVSDNNANLFVSYVIDPTLAFDPAAQLVDQIGKWCITGTHTDVQSDPANFPTTKKGSPIPGQFAYSEVYDCVESATQMVENMWKAGDPVYIAAHAKVKQLLSVETDLPGFEGALPEQVTIMPINYPNADAYFDVEVSGGTNLDGTYPTWCIDKTHTIYTDREYTANVYSSYEPLPVSLTGGTDPHIDNEDNLDLVNYIINQDWKSQGYTSGNVQNAIWTLIDDNPPACGEKCQEIVDDALTNGEGYVPPCGGVVAVVLEPENNAQVVIGQALTIQVGTECIITWGDETAWGGDYWNEEGPQIPFEGARDWSIYFQYNVVNSASTQ